MSNFKFTKLNLNDAQIIEPFLLEDERGLFNKFYEKDIYTNNGINFNVSENFYSTSKKGVLRGLHMQLSNPQSKLITVLNGIIYDVIVDMRINSPTYLKWLSIELSSENKKVLYVPKGFAHGFLTLSSLATIQYLCDGKYESTLDSGIVWNDDQININWPLETFGGIDKLIISKKDNLLPTVAEYEQGAVFKHE